MNISQVALMSESKDRDRKLNENRSEMTIIELVMIEWGQGGAGYDDNDWFFKYWLILWW